MFRGYFCAFLILSLLYKENNWIFNWKADDKIITNASCLVNDSNCFGTDQDTIIVDFKESRHFGSKNPCEFPFKYLNKTYNSCTRMEGTSTGYPKEEAYWCATSVDTDLNMQTYGFCNDKCPLEGTVQVF